MAVGAAGQQAGGSPLREARLRVRSGPSSGALGGPRRNDDGLDATLTMKLPYSHGIMVHERATNVPNEILSPDVDLQKQVKQAGLDQIRVFRNRGRRRVLRGPARGRYH